MYERNQGQVMSCIQNLYTPYIEHKILNGKILTTVTEICESDYTVSILTIRSVLV